MSQKHQFKLIQIFRGLAALLVLLFHLTGNISESSFNNDFLSGYFIFGGAGVDFFFVLSGLVILYSSRELLQKKRYGTYIKLRLVRIYPMYWIVAAVIFLVRIREPFFFQNAFSGDWRNIVSTFLLLPEHTMLNGVSWSLSYELYFYFLFLLIFSFRSARVSFTLVGIYAVLIIAAGTFGAWKNNFFVSPLILDFFLGLLVLPICEFVSLHKYARALMFLGAVLFFVSGLSFYFDHTFIGSQFSRLVFFGFPSFLIILGALMYEKEKQLSPPAFLVRMGDMSYCLYLIHVPLVVIIVKITDRFLNINTWQLNSLGISSISLILMISFAIHFFLEKPMTAFLKRKL